MPLSASEGLISYFHQLLGLGAQWPSTVSSLLIVGMFLLCTQWEAVQLQSTGSTTTLVGRSAGGPAISAGQH